MVNVGGCCSWSRESWGTSFPAGEQLLPQHLRTDRVNVVAQRDRVGGWVSLPTRCHKAEAGVEAAGAAGRGSERRGRDLSSLKGRVGVPEYIGCSSITALTSVRIWEGVAF